MLVVDDERDYRITNENTLELYDVPHKIERMKAPVGMKDEELWSYWTETLNWAWMILVEPSR